MFITQLSTEHDRFRTCTPVFLAPCSAFLAKRLLLAGSMIPGTMVIPAE